MQGPEPGPVGPRRARPRHQGHGLRPSRRRRDSSSVAQVQSKVRAAFAAGASGKKKLNKREQKDARGPRPSIYRVDRSRSRPRIVSPAHAARDEAETAAERLLEEIDANQDADDGAELCGNQIYVEMSVPYRSTEPARPRIAEK